MLVTIVVMMLFVSLAIAWVFLRAGADAVNDLTQHVMLNVIERIGNDNEHHLNEAFRAIETLAPDTHVNNAPPYFPTDESSLEDRLWFASHLYEQTTNYVYFAKPDGSFIGIYRADSAHAKLYLRHANEALRSSYDLQYPGDRAHFLGSAAYDPRLRSWYTNAQKHETPVWSEIYDSFSNNEPTITLAKVVYQPDHSLAGVVATDITLKNLSDYLRSLHISKHGMAFIIDTSGYLIASSDNTPPYDILNPHPERNLADSTPNKLIRQVVLNTIKDNLTSADGQLLKRKTLSVDNEKIDVAYATLGRKFGLRWITVVVIPRSDFMGGINHGLFQSIVIVAVFILLALVIGLIVFEHMLRDIRQLTNAAKKNWQRRTTAATAHSPQGRNRAFGKNLY